MVSGVKNGIEENTSEVKNEHGQQEEGQEGVFEATLKNEDAINSCQEYTCPFVVFPSQNITDL